MILMTCNQHIVRICTQIIIVQFLAIDDTSTCSKHINTLDTIPAGNKGALQRFAGRLSEENRQGAPCGFVMYMCIV